MANDKFIFCLEGVKDIDSAETTEVIEILEEIALQQEITSVYRACDTIEGLEESLNILLYEDNNFKEYEIIYLVMPGDPNSICLNAYHYSMEEIAELFDGKMKGKIVHFANKKIVDLTSEESQYFLDITGARAISGYGTDFNGISSTSTIDRAFFSLFQENDDLKEVVETLFEKHYNLCKLLDFRMYY